MKQESINKSLFRIGLPILAGMCVSQVQQITDQAFLGHASAEYLSAVGNAGFTIWTTISFLFALGTGTAILVSQKLGEGNRDKAEEILGSTFVFSSFFSVAVFLIWFFFNKQIFGLMGLKDPILGYAALYTRIYTFGVILSGISSAANAVYNGTGYTRPIMISSALRALINIVLDWLLIFGNLGFPKLGIAGAAIATLTADLIGSAYGISAAFSHKLPIRLSLGAIRKANIRNYLTVIKIGIPAGLEEFAWNLGNILLIRFLNAVSPLAAGIYTIVASITLVPALFFMAMGNAAMTLSGRFTGGRQPAEIRRTVKNALALSWVGAALFFALFTAFPDFFAGLFTRDPEVLSQTPKMLLVCSFALFARAANLIYGGGIRGMGDTRWMLYTQIFGTVFVLTLARIFIFNLSLAILGLFVAVFFDELARCVLNGIHFYRSVRVKVQEQDIPRVEVA